MGREFVQEQLTKRIVSGWQEGLLAAGLTGTPVLIVLATVPDSLAAHTAALIAGMVAGVLLLIAALNFYFYWLTTPSRRHSWTASAMVVLAVQVLASSAIELTEPTRERGILLWGSAVDLLGTAVVLMLMLIGGRAVRNPQPLLVGLGLGLGLTVLHVTGPVDTTFLDPSPAAAGLLLLTIVAGQLAIAWLVLRDHNLTDWARNRLALTVGLVGVAHVAGSGAFEGWATDLAAATAQVGAAGLWASATFVLLRDALATQHLRSIALEGSLLEIESSLRGSREQLHEIRSTVAGAASAARLLDDHSIGAATHARLERAIRTELDRLERLVAHETPASPGPVDLDATMDVLLESHRAQGRTVVWEPSGGATVHARPDDIAEALNILLDNAATHGGTASRVDVTRAENVVEIAVSDEGPGVPLEARDGIFDWGVHGSDSPGEGIGLSVARRLVSEHGGTLTLAEPDAAPGSSFIIRLPSARRSEEDDVRDAGHSA
jgi:signal transduction histidine kinase